MLNEKQQIQLITGIVGKAIDSGQIKFEQQPLPQPVAPQTGKDDSPPSYEGGRVTFFDLLTCIMFTLNLLGLTDINWFLVFLPFAFPYIVFYGMLWSMMLWAKFKNRKNKDNGEGKND